MEFWNHFEEKCNKNHKFINHNADGIDFIVITMHSFRLICVSPLEVHNKTKCVMCQCQLYMYISKNQQNEATTIDC